MSETATLTPTKEIAEKVLRTVDAGLVCGIGNPMPGEMCVEAAVCYAFGLPHSDRPPCVGAAVRSFKIALNDGPWSSNAARTAGLRKLSIAQLGSEVLDQLAFAKGMALKTTKQVLPSVLRKAALVVDEPHKSKLESAAKLCEEAVDFESGRAAAIHAREVSAYASAYASASAYAYASASAYAYAYAYEYAYAYAEERDRVLNLIGECGLELLIEMKSPGCEWLDLCEVKVKA